MQHIAAFLSFESLVLLYSTNDRTLIRKMVAPHFLDSLRVYKLSDSISPLGNTFLHALQHVRRISFDQTACEDTTKPWSFASLVTHLNATSLALDHAPTHTMDDIASFPSNLLEFEVESPNAPTKQHINHILKAINLFPQMCSLIIKDVLHYQVPNNHLTLTFPSSLTRLHIVNIPDFPTALLDAVEAFHASNIVDFALKCSFQRDYGQLTINLQEWLPHGIEKLSIHHSRFDPSIFISHIPSTVQDLALDADYDNFQYEMVQNLPCLTTLRLTRNFASEPSIIKSHLLPRGLKHLYLLGKAHETLSKSIIDLLPSDLASISAQSITLELALYFHKTLPNCKIESRTQIGINESLGIWKLFFAPELVDLDPASLHNCIRLFLQNINLTMTASTSPSDIGVWTDAVSFTLSTKELILARPTYFDPAALGAHLLEFPTKTMPNLISIDLDLTGPDVKAVRLRDIPRCMTSLELHNTPIFGDFSDLPPNLTRIQSWVEVDMKNYLGMPSALPNLLHLDTPHWTFSCSSLFKNARKNMTRLCLTITDIVDDQIVDLLTNKIDASSRNLVELSLLYNVSGALVEDAFRDFGRTVSWTDVIAATESALTSLLETPFPGTSVPLKSIIVQTSTTGARLISVPYSTESVRLDPREVFSLAPIRQWHISSAPSGDVATALESITSISGVSPQSFFFMPYSPLIKLELIGVFVNANWWSQLPVTLRELHISSSSSLPVACNKLPTHLESFVYLCNARHYSPLSLPLKSLPRSLVHLVSLPSSIPMESLEALDGVLDLPNLKSLRLGPTSPTVASALVNLLPMHSLERMELEQVFEDAPSPQNSDEQVQAPSYPVRFHNIHIVDEVTYEDICTLPRPPKLRTERTVSQHPNAFATGNGSSELNNANKSWAKEYSNIRSTMKITTITTPNSSSGS